MKKTEDDTNTLASAHDDDMPVTIRPDFPGNGIHPPGQQDADSPTQDTVVLPPANKDFTFSSTRALNGSPSEKEGQRILKELCSIPGIEYGGIYEVDPLTQDGRLILFQYLDPDFLNLAYLLPRDSANARIVRQGFPYYMAFKTPAPDNGSFYDIMRKQGHKNVVCIPMMMNGEAVGALNLASLTLPGFPPEIRQHLESVAEKLAPLVDRIRQERLADGRHSESYLDAVEEEVYVVDEDNRILHANRPALRHMPELQTMITGRDAMLLRSRDGTFRITTASGDCQCRHDILCPRELHGEWQGVRVLFRAGPLDQENPDET